MVESTVEGGRQTVTWKSVEDEEVEGCFRVDDDDDDADDLVICSAAFCCCRHLARRFLNQTCSSKIAQQVLVSFLVHLCTGLCGCNQRSTSHQDEPGVEGSNHAQVGQPSRSPSEEDRLVSSDGEEMSTVVTKLACCVNVAD